MDPPSSPKAAGRFMIRVGLGRKKPQRQPSLRRNPSVSQRSPGGTTRLDRPMAAPGAETGLPPTSPTSPVIPCPNGAIAAKPPASTESAAQDSSPADSHNPAHQKRSPQRDALAPSAEPQLLQESAQPRQQQQQQQQQQQPQEQQISSDLQRSTTSKKSRGFLGRLTTKLRSNAPSPIIPPPAGLGSAAAGVGSLRSPVSISSPRSPRRTSHDSAPRRGASVQRRGTRGVGAGPPLPNSLASKSKREEALRARGLLPPARVRYLSELEAEEDRRLGVVQEREDTPSSDDGPSKARELAEMWRAGNSAISLHGDKAVTDNQEQEKGKERLSIERQSLETSMANKKTDDGQGQKDPGQPFDNPVSAFDGHNIAFLAPQDSPLSFGQAYASIPEPDSPSILALAPPPPPKKTPPRHPLGPRPSPPSSPRGSLSLPRSRTSLDDALGLTQTQPLSLHSRTPTADTTSTAKVTQWLRTSTSTPPPVSVSAGTLAAPRTPVSTSASSQRTATPAGAQRRASGESSRGTPGSPSRSLFAVQQSAPRSPAASTRTFEHATPPPSPPMSRSPGIASLRASPRARASMLPPPTGPLPLPPSPSDKFSTHPESLLPPLPTPPSPTARARPAALHPSNSMRSGTTATTASSPSSPTIPSLLDSVSSHISQSTSASGSSIPVTPSLPSLPAPNGAKGTHRAGKPPMIVEEGSGPRSSRSSHSHSHSEEFGVLPQGAQPLPIPRVSFTAASAERPKSAGLFGRKKERSQTLGGAGMMPPAIGKPLSLSNLRRTVSGAIRSRGAQAPVPPVPVNMASLPLGVGAGARARTPVAPTIHSPGTILLETRGIEDEESRRLSEMAFLD